MARVLALPAKRKATCAREIASHLMKTLYLDELAVDGGDGVEMQRRIKKAAVRLGPSGI
jgi:hypothetical protein